MDLNALPGAIGMFVGILALVGLANLLDFGLRNLAEEKAQRAEAIRLRKWGLPAPMRPEEPKNDEHLWHF